MKPLKITFSNCMVDVDARKLFVDGRPRTLQPLIFDLLMHLLMSNGRNVSRQELIEVIWLGRETATAVVCRAVMKARRAVCVDAPNGLIWTIHGSGYRLASDVEVTIHHASGDASKDTALARSLHLPGNYR
jgi:DNA-binding winged helix-turn-helix (wHTH) protein